MQIRINHNGTEVFVDVPESGLDHAVKATKELYDMVTSAEVKMPAEDIAAHIQTISGHAQKKESFGIRERIPNNTVDIEKLDIKQAVTENALVRCPKCGQAHSLIVKDGKKLFLMRKNYDRKEFQIISEAELSQINQLLCYENKFVECFEDLQNAKAIEDKDFAVTNESELFCPVCHQSDTFINWKDAWENPLHFFETDNICEICGGEVSMSVKKDGHEGGICNKCKTEVIDGRPIPKQ